MSELSNRVNLCPYISKKDKDIFNDLKSEISYKSYWRDRYINFFIISEADLLTNSSYCLLSEIPSSDLLDSIKFNEHASEKEKILWIELKLRLEEGLEKEYKEYVRKSNIFHIKSFLVFLLLLLIFIICYILFG